MGTLPYRFPPEDNQTRAFPPPRYGIPGHDVDHDEIEHDPDRLQHLLHCPPENGGPPSRPQTTGDVPRISVTQAVQNSLRK